jgi:4-carboxymuconolactone decarboxylase
MNLPDGGTERAVSGRERRARAQGRHTEKLGEALAALDPDLLEYANGFIFGSVWEEHPDLPFQDGIPPARIKEALKMLVVYIGFPPAISALATFDEVAAKYAPEG